MYKPKQTESKLLIYQKYVDLIEYGYRLLREQSKKKMKRKLKNFEKLYKKGKIELSYITACINSWKGHAKHANSFHLVKNC